MKWYNGEKKACLLRRLRCDRCRRLHIELPDVLTPYKHYATEIIENVVDEVSSPDDPSTEDYPCERTMQRWSEWIRRNTTQIDGFLRSICRRLSDPGKEHLDPALDRDKKIQMRKDLASRNDLSEKTLRRYESSYQEKGFAGLKPAERVRRARIPEEVNCSGPSVCCRIRAKTDEEISGRHEELFQTFLQAKSDDADSGRYQIRSEASHRSRRKAGSDLSVFYDR